MPRDIALANQHPRLRFDARAVRTLFAVLDDRFRFTPADRPALTAAARRRARTTEPALPPGELSVVFLTDGALAGLHARFLDDPSTTDVITFEGTPELGAAGEICVSVDTAARYAREKGGDFAEELSLYLVHGWLHLAGYDDLQPAKKRRMRAAEARALSLLKLADALPAFSLKSR